MFKIKRTCQINKVLYFSKKMRQYTKEKIKELAPQWLLNIRKRYYANKKYQKGPERRNLLKIEMHLADHCNLNCNSCSHFSPLADENYLNIDMFERDCQRIAELSSGNLEVIRFMGGEPLLHKNIIDILNIGRKYFPDTALDIVTNGIILPQQTEEFWNTCRINNIQIHISNYPLKINQDEINSLAEQHNVKVIFLNNKTGLHWNNMRLDVNGGQNIEESFKLCSQSNFCINLYEGKLFTCPTIAYVKYLNKYFKENFIVTNDDYIDIYKVKNIDEILDFLCKPPPFCKYCNIKNQRKIDWNVSNKDRNEWIE